MKVNNDASDNASNDRNGYVVTNDAMTQTISDCDVCNKNSCQCEFIQPPRLAKASGRFFLGKICMEFC